MSNDNTTVVKVANYSPEQVEAIRAACPMNFEQAEALGKTFDPVKSGRSIVSKIKTMPDLEYIKKVAPEPKAKPETKAEVVASIEAELEVDSGFFGGLEKATVQALQNLRTACQYDDPELDPAD